MRRDNRAIIFEPNSPPNICRSEGERNRDLIHTVILDRRRRRRWRRRRGWRRSRGFC